MSGVLAGVRILLAEDEFLIAALVADCLVAEGAVMIGPAANLAQAERAAASEQFDIAVLDWNLGGEQSDPVARIVVGRGLPCVISTGYGAVHQEFAQLPVIAKPYEPAQLVSLVAQTLARGQAA